MNFCRRCGKPLDHLNDHVYKCKSGHTLFANASPTVGIFFLTEDNQVVLSVRGIEPHKGMLDTFGGFLDGEETAEAAVARELQEELNLQPGDYEAPTYLTSAIGHYPFAGETLSVLSLLFWSRLTTKKPLIPADDVADVRIIPLHEVNMEDLHDDDIRVGLKMLQRLFPASTSNTSVSDPS